VKRNGPREGPCGYAPLGPRTPDRAVRRMPPSRFTPRALSLPLSLPPTPLSSPTTGWTTAAAAAYAAALRQVPTPSSVSSPATSTHQVFPPLLFPSLPFLLCETEHPNPNLNLFGYLMSTSFEIFAKIIGCTCPFTGSALVLVLTVAATSRYCLQYFLQ